MHSYIVSASGRHVLDHLLHRRDSFNRLLRSYYGLQRFNIISLLLSQLVIFRIVHCLICIIYNFYNGFIVIKHFINELVDLRGEWVIITLIKFVKLNSLFI